MIVQPRPSTMNETKEWSSVNDMRTFKGNRGIVTLIFGFVGGKHVQEDEATQQRALVESEGYQFPKLFNITVMMMTEWKASVVGWYRPSEWLCYVNGFIP